MWVACAAITACTPEAPKPRIGLPSVRVQDVPHVQQKPGFSGEAAATMALRRLGHHVDQDHVFDRTGVDPLLGRGAGFGELRRGLSDIGLEVGADEQARGTGDMVAFRALHAELTAGSPPIAELRGEEEVADHFVLVTGYDAAEDEVVYRDPADEDGSDLAMSRDDFLGRWSGRLIRTAEAAAREIRVAGPSPTSTPADYAQHIMALRPRLGIGMTLVLLPPFVVIGDDERSRVQELSDRLVRLAQDDYEAHYFHRRPGITEVWMLRTDETYAHHVERLTGHAPTTPYGFYDDSSHAIYANMSTGGGTLLHELVHPYMHASFPDCPPWYNEGMGSLFEGSRIVDGRMRGALNWRLNGLKKSIEQDHLRPLSELFEDDADAFYDEDSGDNYGASRYLVYYLQEHSLLDEFHDTFLRRHVHDPTGRRTLERLVGQPLDHFEPRWRDWVMQLEQQPVFLTFAEPEFVRGRRWR